MSILSSRRVTDGLKGYKADELDTSVYKTDIPTIKGCTTNKADESLYQSQWTVKWEENRSRWRGTKLYHFKWFVLLIIVVDVVFRHKHVEPPKPGEELYCEIIELINRLTVTFVTRDGDRTTLQVQEGDSLLDIAHEHDIDLEGAS